MKTWYSIGFSLIFLLSCTDDIGGKSDSETGLGVTCEVDSSAVVKTTVDATSEEDWVYLDFETFQTNPESCGWVDEANSGADWDIAFLRYNPKINGGVSGSGGVEVAIVDRADFEALEVAPGDSYVVDVEDDDEDDVPEYAMESWYDYDVSTHFLTPADVVYVLRTTEGQYIKLRFDDYYDDAGTGGYPSFSWSFIDQPDPDADVDTDTGDDIDEDTDALINCASGDSLVTTTEGSDAYTTVIDSSGTDSWVCFSFSMGEQTDTDWDVAWQNWDTATTVRAGGMVLPEQDFDALTEAPESGWIDGDSDLLDDWYIYDSSTHVLTPKDRVYVIRDAESQVWKLQITTYYSSTDDLHRPTFRWAPISG